MARRRLAEAVVARVVGGVLALDFPGQVVVNVFGLPIVVGETEVVDGRANHVDSVIATVGVYGVYWHESSADLEGAVCRRRFLTIVLPLHRFGELLHYTTLLVVQLLGPSTLVYLLKAV